MTLTPVKGIREKCKDCSETLSLICNCEITNCSLYPYRMGKNQYRGKEKPPTYRPPLKAIRAYCLGCCLDQPKEVRQCPAGDCAAHPFRFGNNPFTSEAKREAGRKAMQRLKNSPSTEVFRTISSSEGQYLGLDLIQENTR
tara:strand:+ start:620 stop:1042 length:423 start_codon:yes stop_codon:yes gene_type:complete